MSAKTPAPSSRHTPIERVMLGADAQDLLSAAVGTRGMALESWQLRDVHARPGAETSASYDVMTSGTPLHLIVSSIDLSPQERCASGVVRLESPAGVVHVWEHPRDPKLVGLPVACSASLLGQRLTQVKSTDVTVADLDMVVYRPLRRAVLRARISSAGEDAIVYVKVVRPPKAADVVRRHQLFAGHGVPPCRDLGQGLVLIDQAAGRSLAEHLLANGGNPERFIAPELLLERLETLPANGVDMPARSTVTDKRRRYVAGAIKQGRDEERVLALADAIERVITHAPTGPVVTTHGDYNVANIFVEGTGRDARVSGLIDVDTLGPGYMIDDVACLMAHLAVLPGISPKKFAAVPPYVGRLLGACEGRMDGAGLRARAAANVLSLVSGMPDTGRAEAWLSEAERLAHEAVTMMRKSS